MHIWKKSETIRDFALLMHSYLITKIYSDSHTKYINELLINYCIIMENQYTNILFYLSLVPYSHWCDRDHFSRAFFFPFFHSKTVRSGRSPHLKSSSTNAQHLKITAKVQVAEAKVKRKELKGAGAYAYK